MPHFERCPKTVATLASELLAEFEDHAPLINARVNIDYVFAFCDRDENGNALNEALKKNGVRAYGIARKIPAKERALGRGDAEIALDADWWNEASDEEQRALLDHELHHLTVVMHNGIFAIDQQGRPKIQLRKHDWEFGWFDIIARRHGSASIERQQAYKMFEIAGQFYWPEISGAIRGDGRRRVAQVEVART